MNLEQVLADWAERIAVLRAAKATISPDTLAEFRDAVVTSAEDYVTFLSEGEAMIRSGKSKDWLRSRFPEWERAGHAKRDGRHRYYRMLVVPQRANTAAAYAAGRRAS